MYFRERAIAEQAARAAGAIIRQWYERPLDVRDKGNDNPVTQADLEADRCLHELLCGEFPEDGWLSEESKDSTARLARPRVWIVDPLDGTREFIEHIPELAVAIALVEDGAPVVGVEYNPIRDELFSCARGAGTTLNGRPVRVTECADPRAARVLASRSEIKRGEWKPFEEHVRVVATGSVAYKLACIAAGKAEATFSLTPKHEWDVCAGVALIREAGGVVTDCDGAPLRFNQEKPWLPGLIASGRRLHGPLRELIARIAGENAR